MQSRAAMLCLGLIVVQNSSLILVTSYSRTLKPAYLPSVAVTLSEVLKLIAAGGLLVHESRSTSKALRQAGSLMSEHSRVTFQFAVSHYPRLNPHESLSTTHHLHARNAALQTQVPALCYTLQNNLWCAPL